MKQATSCAKRTFILAAVLSLALASCSQRETVKFGVILPLTGDFAVYGQSVKKGVELAYDVLKADSGIPYDVEIEIVDSGSDPEKAARLAETLYGTGALALIGGLTSAEALAMVEVAKEEERVLLSPTASSDELTGKARTFYRIFPTARQESSAMANFAQETLDVEELVLIVEDRPFTQGIHESFAAVFEQYGGTVKEEIQYANGEPDFEAVVDQALALEPTGIYLATSGRHVGEFVKVLRAREYGRKEGQPEWIMTTSAFSHPDVIAQALPEANGVYLTQPVFDISSEEGAMPAFVAAYREKFGQDPDLYAGHGYDALVLFGEALKKTMNTLPSEFHKGMRAMDPLAGVTGNIQFNEHGDVQKFPRIHLVMNGDLMDFQAWRTEREKALKQRLQELRDESRRLRTQQLQ